MRIIERMRAELRGFMNKSIHLFVRTFSAALDCRSDDDISRRHGEELHKRNQFPVMI